jgi:hypothetical protein
MILTKNDLANNEETPFKGVGTRWPGLRRRLAHRTILQFDPDFPPQPLILILDRNIYLSIGLLSHG